MKPFFTAEDFHKASRVIDGDLVIKIKYAVDLANAKIEREGKVVFTGPSYKEQWIECENMFTTQRALLINIEPLEKCEHPENNLSVYYIMDRESEECVGHSYKCECGARVTPAKFEEVRE